jgi:hypothetical protein
MAKEKSDLELTAADHEKMGSDPPKILKQNPGKSLADLMSDAELKKKILEERELLNNDTEANPDRSLQTYYTKELEFIMKYLRKSGRLPELL